MSCEFVRVLVQHHMPRAVAEALARMWRACGLKKIKLATLSLSLEEEEAHGTNA